MFLFLSPALAYSNAESMRISYSGSNTIRAIHSSARAELVEFEQQIYLYPIDELIIVEELTNLNVSDNLLLFSKQGDFQATFWDFSYIVDSNRSISFVESNPVFPYPVQDLPVSVRDYLDFSVKVDSNNDLRLKASEIVSGVSDYLTAVLLIGEWVYDYLNYSLVEPYSSTVVRASQVFADERGVCDEYSMLFMSLARSLGIPCRYVTGYAFGNVLGLSDFGPHAWVEVYVPGHGWIGMDPTYGQFGWFDASHVSFFKAWNSSSNFISTSRTGYFIDELEITNELPEYLTSSFGSEASGFIVNSVVNESSLLNVSVSIGQDFVAEGEYFLLNVSIFNPTDYFIPLSYEVISTAELHEGFINASNYRSVLVEPLSTVSSYTLIRAPFVSSGGQQILYETHPLSVYVPLGGTVDLGVKVDPSIAPSSSLEELSLLMDDRVLLEGVEFVNLSLSSSVVYEPVVNLSLVLRNNGNTVLDDLSVSVYGDLTSDESLSIDSLGINELVDLSLPLNVTSLGEGSVRVYVTAGNSSLDESLPFTALTHPSLSLGFEGLRSFNGDPEFKVLIFNPLNINIPELNLSIITPHDSLSKSFLFGQAPSYEVDSGFPEAWLDFGDNEVVLRIDYVDELGTHFAEELIVNLNREGGWWELLLDSISKFFNSIISLFSS